MSDGIDTVRQQRWNALLGRLGGIPAESWDVVRTSYDEPQRTYHTIAHIAHCLAVLDTTPDVPSRDLVETALWLHDIVYDPREADNEEASAVVAGNILRGHGIQQVAAAGVEECIRLTRHDRETVTGPGAWVVDIDLAILGAEPADFASYENAIRREYAWVNSGEYREGRITVLRKFLGRRRIYHTDHFEGLLAERARSNLEAAVIRLAEATEP